MAEKTSLPLPLANQEYDEINEAITRRTIEQAIQDINAEIAGALQISVRRHQFLLMGVKHG